VTKDRRLGKGLAALLGTPLEEEVASGPDILPMHPPTAPPAASPRGDGEIVEISVYTIDNNPFQPRQTFDADEIAALAESLRAHQQLQPIIVRPTGDRFQLISGERRLRAAIHAGLKEIRAVVRPADDRLMAELAIVENLQRKDLSPLEKASAFRRYIDQHQCSQEDLARRLKIDRSTIANFMRLLELPAAVQKLLEDEKISAGHAKALLPLSDEQQMVAIAKRMASENWSVRQAEQWVNERLQEEKVAEERARPNRYLPGKRPNIQLSSLEQELKLVLGTKVALRSTMKGTGKIVIHFNSHDEFERLRQLLLQQAAPTASSTGGSSAAGSSAGGRTKVA
jgi:ParB family transcriptional regulator, chromosome partitioning protein